MTQPRFRQKRRPVGVYAALGGAGAALLAAAGWIAWDYQAHDPMRTATLRAPEPIVQPAIPPMIASDWVAVDPPPPPPPTSDAAGQSPADAAPAAPTSRPTTATAAAPASTLTAPAVPPPQALPAARAGATVGPHPSHAAGGTRRATKGGGNSTGTVAHNGSVHPASSPPPASHSAGKKADAHPAAPAHHSKA